MALLRKIVLLSKRKYEKSIKKIERLKILYGATHGAATYGREKSSGVSFLEKGGKVMEKLFTEHMRRQVEDRIFKMSIPELVEVVKVAKLEDGVRKKISGFIVNKVRQNVEEDTLKEIYFVCLKNKK